MAPADFTVTTLTDTGPANGLPGGVGAGLTGDLRFCMTQANTIPESTISFQAANGTILLSNTPLPDIVVNTTITGPAGRGIIVQGTTNQNSPYSVFKVAQGANVAINNLQITNGYAAQNGGGGVQNLGILTLNNDIIRNNFAIGAGQSGGGIYNGVGASLTLTNDLMYLISAST